MPVVSHLLSGCRAPRISQFALPAREQEVLRTEHSCNLCQSAVAPALTRSSWSRRAADIAAKRSGTTKVASLCVQRQRGLKINRSHTGSTTSPAVEKRDSDPASHVHLIALGGEGMSQRKVATCTAGLSVALSKRFATFFAIVSASPRLSESVRSLFLICASKTV